MALFKKKISEEEIESLPVFTFDGEIDIIDCVNEVRRAVKELNTHKCIGFDTETRPSFKKGIVHQIGLLQLATESKVYLFRLNKCGFPNCLQRLLGNENIMKIGVGIRDDIRGLSKRGEFIPSNFLDLQLFAKSFGIEETAFSKLMSIIFGVRISKRQRTSNWDAPVLTPAQVHYAATDAWGALKMYNKLKMESEKQLLLEEDSVDVS